MISIEPGSQRTVLDGAGPQTVVSAPPVGSRRTVVALRTTAGPADVTPILTKVIAGVATEVERREGLTAGEAWKDVITLESRMVLQDETESLVMDLDSVGSAVVIAEYLESRNTP